MGAGRIIATIVFVFIGGAIFALGLIQRKNSDVGQSKPSGVSGLFKPKRKSRKQGLMPGTNGMIIIVLLLVALFFYILVMQK